MQNKNGCTPWKLRRFISLFLWLAPVSYFLLLFCTAGFMLWIRISSQRRRIFETVILFAPKIKPFESRCGDVKCFSKYAIFHQSGSVTLLHKIKLRAGIPALSFICYNCMAATSVAAYAQELLFQGVRPEPEIYLSRLLFPFGSYP